MRVRVQRSRFRHREGQTFRQFVRSASTDASVDQQTEAQLLNRSLLNLPVYLSSGEEGDVSDGRGRGGFQVWLLRWCISESQVHEVQFSCVCTRGAILAPAAAAAAAAQRPPAAGAATETATCPCGRTRTGAAARGRPKRQQGVPQRRPQAKQGDPQPGAAAKEGGQQEARHRQAVRRQQGGAERVERHPDEIRPACGADLVASATPHPPLLVILSTPNPHTNNPLSFALVQASSQVFWGRLPPNAGELLLYFDSGSLVRIGRPWPLTHWSCAPVGHAAELGAGDRRPQVHGQLHDGLGLSGARDSSR